MQQVADEFRKDQVKERGKAEGDANEQLEKAQERLKKIIEQIENDTSMTPAQRRQKIEIARESEQRKLNVVQANIEQKKNQEIERISISTQQKMRAYEDRMRWWAIFIPPIPAIVLGIIVLSARINAEYRNVEADRLVKR